MKRSFLLPLIVLAVFLIGFAGSTFLKKEKTPPPLEQDQTQQRYLEELRQELGKGNVDYYSVYSKYIDLVGVEAIIELIDGDSCHQEGHDLGRVVYEKTQNLTESVHICGSSCTGACFHGAIMGLFDNNKHHSPDLLAQSVEEKCSQDGDPERAATDCAHAVGHGFVFMSDEGDISGALALCSHFSTPLLRHYCALGVFMQYHMDHLAADPRHNPCDANAPFAGVCYKYRALFMEEYFPGDEDLFQLLGTECDALRGSLQQECFRGVGFAYAYDIENRPSQISEVCQYDNFEKNKACMEGAVKNLLHFDPRAGLHSCASLDAALQPACEAAVEENTLFVEREFLVRR